MGPETAFFGLFGIAILIQLLIFIAVAVLFLVSLIEILRNDFEGNNKLLWVLVVLLLPILGPILYFVLGRSQRIKN